MTRAERGCKERRVKRGLAFWVIQHAQRERQEAAAAKAKKAERRLKIRRLQECDT